MKDLRAWIAKLCIGLAVVLLAADLLWALRRIVPYALALVGRSPETLILAAALGLLITAWVIRAERPSPAADPAAGEG